MVQNQNTRNIYLRADDKRCRVWPSFAPQIQSVYRIAPQAAFEEMRLAQALSLLQEFSAGWSRAAEGGGGGDGFGGKRKAVRVVAGYSADWRGDPLALERKMAAFCVEVWTLECLGKRKESAGFEDSVSATLRLSSRVNKSLLALEFKLGSADGKPVLFPLSLFLEEMRMAVTI